MAVSRVQPVPVAECRAALAGHALEPAGGLEQGRQLGHEARAVARVRRDRALPRRRADDVAGVRERERRRGAVLPRGEHAARVVEVQVRQHDDVDLLRRDAEFLEAVEQHMAVLLHAEALPQRRREEGADAGLEQDEAAAVVDQQAPAGEVDAVVLVGRRPPRPQRLRRVAEHRAPVELLPVAEHRPGAAAHRTAAPSAKANATRRATSPRRTRSRLHSTATATLSSGSR